jgi:glutathione S-transferase
MTALPILYSFRRCPYAMRARLALLISGTACELREISLRSKPPEMIAVSPKATVPVLVLPDGAVIDESLDIMRWALGRNDPEAWLAFDDDAIIVENDGAFKYHLDRYKYPERYGSNSDEHRAECLAILARLDMLLEGRENLRGETRSLVDMAVMPFVRQFAATDRGWFDAQPLARVRDWLDRHLASFLFERAMVRVRSWQPGDAPVFLSLE